MSNRKTLIGEVGEYKFFETTFGSSPNYYTYSINGKGTSWVYETLDRAIVSAIGAKYTGEQGAGVPASTLPPAGSCG